MENKSIASDNFSPSQSKFENAKSILQDFNDTLKTLGETKNLLEYEITSLRNELGNLAKEKDILETDFGESREASEIAITAKAAEEEKQDALLKNQELRSYLDSAADKIKAMDLQIAEEVNEIKRLHARAEALETEKVSRIKENGDLQSQIQEMNNTIAEQDFNIRNLSMRIETLESDKKNLGEELTSTKNAQDEIQKLMASVKNKMRRGGLDETFLSA